MQARWNWRLGDAAAAQGILPAAEFYFEHRDPGHQGLNLRPKRPDHGVILALAHVAEVGKMGHAAS